MKLNILVVGYLQENCYILEKNNKVLIIDPGDEFNKINNFIKDKTLVGILITHNHFDHIGALKPLMDTYKVKVYDKTNLEEKDYQIEDFIFEVIYTPGHTKEEITYYFKENNSMFTGDFLFQDGIGRCDLPGGNEEEMLDSLFKMKEYPRDIIIYPGHGEKSILGMELDKYV